MYKIGLERLLQEVAQYCNDMGFSQKTCDLIFDAFSAPARNVAAGYGNVSGRDNSAKMGIVVQWESNKVERPLQHKIENDIRALFYADQVGPYKVAYRRRDGHNATWTHTPDCLVCYEDEAGFVEFKPTKELERLSVVHPDRYARRDGKWVCPAGERFAAQYGLFYRIWTSDDIDWNQERNIRFLESYLQFKRPVEKTVSEEIIAVCDANFGISLKDVLEKYDADDVYALIAAGIIYCDLCSAPIAEPDRVRLFSCREKGEGFKVLASSPSASSVIRITAFKVEPGACLEWNGSTWIIGSVEEGAICIVDGQGHILQLPNAAFEKLVNEDALKPEKVAMENGAPQEVQEILRKSSPKDMKTADFRLAAIRYLLDGKVGHDTHSNMSPRVRRHWMKLYKNAERNWGYGFIGLIPKPRGRKLDAEQLAKEDIQFALDVIKEYYDNVRARNAYTAYAIYKKKCADDGKAPVSDQTFYSMIKHRDLYEQELARRGKKAAYPFKPYQDQWDEALPIHGDYPWQYVHTDHTKADIRFRDPDTGRVLTRRATISTLFDAFSRRVLVVLITMEAPSALTMLTLIRECVRRHGRLPANIIHDGGVEFGSTDFQKLCARLGIALMKRPPSESRFGSVIERNFHTMTTQLIHNLLGNTKIMKNVREVHPSVNPENLAIWDLESFIQEMEYYCYEKYDRDEHSTLRQSPREAYENGLRKFGMRSHLRVEYNDELIVQTLPTPEQAERKIVREKGVKIFHEWYWHQDFRIPKIIGTNIQVRYDPQNIAVAYAFVNGRWIQCRSRKYYPKLKDRPPEYVAYFSKLVTERLKESQGVIKDEVVWDGAYNEYLDDLEKKMLSETDVITEADDQESPSEKYPAEKAGTVIPNDKINKTEDLSDD